MVTGWWNLFFKVLKLSLAIPQSTPRHLKAAIVNHKDVAAGAAHTISPWWVPRNQPPDRPTILRSWVATGDIVVVKLVGKFNQSTMFYVWVAGWFPMGIWACIKLLMRDITNNLAVKPNARSWYDQLHGVVGHQFQVGKKLKVSIARENLPRQELDRMGVWSCEIEGRVITSYCHTSTDIHQRWRRVLGMQSGYDQQWCLVNVSLNNSLVPIIPNRLVRSLRDDQSRFLFGERYPNP